MEAIGEKVAFMTAKEIADKLNRSIPTIQRWAAEAPPGTLFAQCSRGRWHKEQVRLMEAISAGAISRESGESRWRLFKHEMENSLPPESRR